MRCDGSGILTETYTAPDTAVIVPCPGCPECDELLAELEADGQAELDLDARLEDLPLWAGMNVYDVPPMKMAREVFSKGHAGLNRKEDVA